MGSAMNEWIDILTEIPQSSILGPLIFNAFINDLIILCLLKKQTFATLWMIILYKNLGQACR